VSSACTVGAATVTISSPRCAVSMPSWSTCPVRCVPGAAEAWGAREYAALLNETLPEMTDRPVLAVGHSFGGRVAVCAAAARPDLFSGLVLTGVPLIRPGGAAKPRSS